jgi:hypothetical protein
VGRQRTELSQNIQLNKRIFRRLCTASAFECSRFVESSGREERLSKSPSPARLRSKGHAIKSLIVRTEVALRHAFVGDDLRAMNRSFTDHPDVGCGEHMQPDARTSGGCLTSGVADSRSQLCVRECEDRCGHRNAGLDCFDVDWVRLQSSRRRCTILQCTAMPCCAVFVQSSKQRK